MWAASLAQLGGNAPYCSYRPSSLSVAVFTVQNDDLRLAQPCSDRRRRGGRWSCTSHLCCHLCCHLYLEGSVPAPALSRALIVYAVNSVNFRGNSSPASRRARHSWFTPWFTLPVLAASARRAAECWLIGQLPHNSNGD